MIDEGYIKFNCQWTEDPQPVIAHNDPILAVRDHMFHLGLIGHDKTHDVGYGNISKRVDDGFVISGTQTGHHVHATAAHFSKVNSYHIAGNKVACTGPVKASSESLTHAAIYELSPEIQVVIHVHHKAMWNQYLNLLPSSKPDVPYGTPEMAKEIFRLWRLPDLPEQKILFMGGHEDGIISFDSDFETAAERLAHYLAHC